MLIAHLRRIWRVQQFNPGWIGLFVNPFFLTRRGLWVAMASMASEARGRMLDVGCGTQPYRALFNVERYIGLELDTPAARERGIADAFYDGQRFPFADAHFETVLCNQVLEHVFNPEEFVAELRRVLAPGGRLLLTAPFVWDEHEQPFDYARYSTFGLRALLERHGLHVVEQQRLLADSSLLFQLANAYLYKVLPSHRVIRLVATVALMAPLSMLGLLFGWLLPKNPDLFLDQAIVATPVVPISAGVATA